MLTSGFMNLAAVLDLWNLSTEWAAGFELRSMESTTAGYEKIFVLLFEAGYEFRNYLTVLAAGYEMKQLFDCICSKLQSQDIMTILAAYP